MSLIHKTMTTVKNGVMNTRNRADWERYLDREADKVARGLRNGTVRAYNLEEIELMRNVQYRGLPGSLYLLVIDKTNGQCNTSALLLARALLDSPNIERVHFVSAYINGLGLNPEYRQSGNPEDARHSYVRAWDKDGQAWIYDTSTGLVYLEKIFNEVEMPRVLGEYGEEAIRRSYKQGGDFLPLGHSKCRDALVEFLDDVGAITAEQLRREIYLTSEVFDQELARWRRLIADEESWAIHLTRPEMPKVAGVAVQVPAAMARTNTAASVAAEARKDTKIMAFPQFAGATNG